MKKALIILLVDILSSCQGQNNHTPKTTHTFEDFGWTITIPEGFDPVGEDEWSKIEERGLEAIEDTYGEEITELAKNVFVYRNSTFNLFQANYQNYDEDIDGDFKETSAMVNQMVYETFYSQMPDASIDTSSSIKTISGREFKGFEVKVVMPNGIKMHINMYSTYFREIGKQMTMNITSVEPEVHKVMLESFYSSKF